MTIVVTGSGGLLGSELSRQLGPRAVGLDLPDFDLTDRDRVVEILTRIRPQAVINTAAFTEVDRAEEEEAACRAVNAAGVAHLVEACGRLDCTLAQISTDYVFGGDSDRRTPYRETDEPCPLGVYARTKLHGEREAARWEKHFVIRTCGLYGRRGSAGGRSFVETMLDLGGRQERVRVVSDQRSTPSYAPHVARAICFLLGTGGFGTYHVVNSGETTWHELAVEVFRQSHLAVEVEPITTSDYGAPAPRPAYSVLDTTKYHALAGAPLMPRWQEALAEYLATLGLAKKQPS
jgi:dTDP-4-dehydrorhamnose reductase